MCSISHVVVAGYEFGHLLISGQAEYNITDDDNSTTTFAPDILGNLTSEENVSYIDVNSSSQLSLWKTGKLSFDIYF